jgi:hypothetical protein
MAMTAELSEQVKDMYVATMLECHHLHLLALDFNIEHMYCPREFLRLPLYFLSLSTPQR